MTAYEAVTTALAAVGAVLGVIGARRNWVQDRVNLKVLLNDVVAYGADPGVNVTVRNLSHFAVTVDVVSLCFVGGREAAISQFAGTSLSHHSGPARLESRTAFTAFIPYKSLDSEQRVGFVGVRARTACGVVVSRWKRYQFTRGLTDLGIYSRLLWIFRW